MFSVSAFLIALIINGFIAALFISLIPTEGNRFQINSLRYFCSFFITSSVCLISFALRLYLPEFIAVLLPNLLLITAVYCFVFALFWRYQNPVHIHKHPALIHIVLYTSLQVALSYLYPDNVIIRLFFAYLNTSLVLLFAFSLVYSNKKLEENKEKLLKATVAIAVVCTVFVPTVYFAHKDQAEFLNALLLIQNTINIMVFGGVFYSSFVDVLWLYKKSASLDPITELYNRRYFFEQASKFLRAAERHQFPISILICDIDGFASVNDKFGHFSGDRLIRELAEIIKGETREEDLLARFGSKEFVILLPQTRINGSMLIAERMREAIEKHKFKFEEKTLLLTASFGVTSISEYVDIETSLRKADIALQQAKSDGHNTVRQFV